MATSVITNPIIGGGVDYYKYDYSADNKLSSLITFMQDNGYNVAIVSFISVNKNTGYTAFTRMGQMILTVEDLQYIYTNVSLSTEGAPIIFPTALWDGTWAQRQNIPSTAYFLEHGTNKLAGDLKIYLF